MEAVESTGTASEPAMNRRVPISFVALFVFPILSSISLSAPSVAQPRVETGAPSGQPHAPAAHGHGHTRGTYIVCDTADVHSCHREFYRKLRARGH